jgi:hypothetical protein
MAGSMPRLKKQQASGHINSVQGILGYFYVDHHDGGRETALKTEFTTEWAIVPPTAFSCVHNLQLVKEERNRRGF